MSLFNISLQTFFGGKITKDTTVTNFIAEHTLAGGIPVNGDQEEIN